MSEFLFTQRLYTIRRTLCKMLTRRGYTVPAEVLAETQELLDAAYVENPEVDLTLTVHRADDALMVFFPNKDVHTNLGIAPIREYLATMEEKGCTRAIMVVHEKLTSPAVTMLKEMELKGIFIAAFSENELLVDIFEHSKVPRHIKLSPDEKQALLRQLRIASDELLPKIQKQDPMARYLGLDVGDVVMIQRYSMTVANDVYYRVVVDSEDF
jgi:DNA-directed RNA polymerase I, II, and III subunit RPABC1